jgi:uncharacterized protein YhaN
MVEELMRRGHEIYRKLLQVRNNARDTGLVRYRYEVHKTALMLESMAKTVKSGRALESAKSVVEKLDSCRDALTKMGREIDEHLMRYKNEHEKLVAELDAVTEKVVLAGGRNPRGEWGKPPREKMVDEDGKVVS